MDLLSFYTTVVETQSDMHQPSSEAVFCDEVAIARGTEPQAQGENITENLL